MIYIQKGTKNVTNEQKILSAMWSIIKNNNFNLLKIMVTNTIEGHS